MRQSQAGSAACWRRKGTAHGLMQTPPRHATAVPTAPQFPSSARNPAAPRTEDQSHLVQSVQRAVQRRQTVRLQARHQRRQQLRPAGKPGGGDDGRNVCADDLPQRPRLVADGHEEGCLRPHTMRELQLRAEASCPRVSTLSRCSPPSRHSTGAVLCRRQHFRGPSAARRLTQKADIVAALPSLRHCVGLLHSRRHCCRHRLYRCSSGCGGWVP